MASSQPDTSLKVTFLPWLEKSFALDLPKLKAAVETDHAPTVAPLADDYQRQIGSDLFVVTNTRGQVLAEIGRSEVTAEQVETMPAVPVC